MNRSIGYMVAAFVLVGCSPNPEPPPTPRWQLKQVELSAGTPVKLVLLRQLESGKDAVGHAFPLMVAEDVKDADGHVLIAQGEIAEGKIARSRRAGALSALSNQPSRLLVTVDSTKDINHAVVELSADPDGQPGEPLELTRDRTGRSTASTQIEALLRDDKSRKALEELPKMLSNAAYDSAALSKIVQDLNLPQTSRLVGENGTAKLQKLLEDAQKGVAIKSLSGGSASATIGALMELAGVAGEVGNRLSGLLKGRNIKAYVGTPIDARVATATKVQVLVATSPVKGG